MNGYEKHWLAGILEGEGSFQKALQGRGKRRAVIEMDSTDLWALQRVRELVGGNQPYRHNPPSRKAHWSPIYRWRIKGAKARELAKNLRPLMSPRRQEQIDALLRYCPTTETPEQGGRTLSIRGRGASGSGTAL